MLRPYFLRQFQNPYVFGLLEEGHYEATAWNTAKLTRPENEWFRRPVLRDRAGAAHNVQHEAYATAAERRVRGTILMTDSEPVGGLV